MKFAQALIALPLAAYAAPAENDVSSSNGVLTINGVQVKSPPAEEPVMRRNAKREWFTLKTAFDIPGNPNPNAAMGGEGHSHGGGEKAGKAPKGKAGGGMGGMGMGGEDGTTKNVRISGSDFCAKGKSCTVLAGQISIINAEGKKLGIEDGIYVHHILTTATKRQQGFVNSLMGNLMGAGFVGAGDDNGNSPFIYTPRDQTLDSGFVIDPQDGFTGNVVLVNYKPTKQTVYVSYDLEYMPGKWGIPIKSSLISASAVGNPKASKSGPVNTTSTNMPFSEDGVIILAKGHLHDGGHAMYMRINRKAGGSFTCVSKATYGSKIAGSTTATIQGMSDCNKQPVAVSAGDSMVMTAEYDLKAHPLRETTHGGEGGTMGMFRIIFAPGRDAVNKIKTAVSQPSKATKSAPKAEAKAEPKAAPAAEE